MQTSLIIRCFQLMVSAIIATTFQSHATGCPGRFIKIRQSSRVPENIVSNVTLIAHSKVECLLKLKLKSCTCWLVDMKKISPTKFQCRLFLGENSYITTKATDESSSIYEPDNNHCENNIHCENSNQNYNIIPVPTKTPSQPPSFTMASTAHQATAPPRLYTTVPTQQPRDCQDVNESGYDQSGVYSIYRAGFMLNVYCYMERTRGWTTIQKRVSDKVSFDRDWIDYQRGFGDASGNYWIGLETIHEMTKNSNDTLQRIHTTKFDGTLFNVVYKGFKIGDAASDYVLTTGTYETGSGSTYAVDWLELNGNKFTTKDKDNDVKKFGNCADVKRGGNWFEYCTKINFNGVWYPPSPENSKETRRESIYWKTVSKGGYEWLKTIDLSIRKNVNIAQTAG